jgi:hypothetical protein
LDRTSKVSTLSGRGAGPITATPRTTWSTARWALSAAGSSGASYRASLTTVAVS